MCLAVVACWLLTLRYHVLVQFGGGFRLGFRALALQVDWPSGSVPVPAANAQRSVWLARSTRPVEWLPNYIERLWQSSLLVPGWILITPILITVGLWVYRRGLVPELSDQYCRICTYPLIASNAVCPECGTRQIAESSPPPPSPLS